MWWWVNPENLEISKEEEGPNQTLNVTCSYQWLTYKSYKYISHPTCYLIAKTKTKHHRKCLDSLWLYLNPPTFHQSLSTKLSFPRKWSLPRSPDGKLDSYQLQNRWENIMMIFYLGGSVMMYDDDKCIMEKNYCRECMVVSLVAF